MKPCIIFDLDGCIADLSHRLHFIKDGNRDWDSFFATVKDDAPIPEICELNEILHKNGEYIIICSGRSSVCMQDTIDWLEEHDVYYDRLMMRQEGDYRPDYTIKEEMLLNLKEEGFDPWLAIDDRQRIAQVWRKHGIMTLQCDDWEEREPTVVKDNPTLYVMVGPSGAGKTTWIRENLPDTYRVSSDDMRFYMTGDYKDQTKNDQVFKACHGVARSLLLQGVDVVFDATSIKNKDRKTVVGCAPEGTTVKYVVIDRPMEDKVRDADWRPTWLLEKHDNTFRSNIKAILNGDGLDNVTVEDHRGCS